MRDLILYSNPFKSLIDNMANDFFDFDVDVYAPKTDVVENDNQFILKMDVPGFSEKNLKVEVKDNYLTVSGNTDNEKSNDDKKEKYIIRERSSASFKRQYRLPENVSNENVEAKLENGVLNLIIKKAEETKAKEIKIK